MPSTLTVTGRRPLRGRVEVSGSKNASLPLIAAALLSDGPTRLRGLPDVTDVAAMLTAVSRTGAAVGRDGDDVVIDGRGVGHCDLTRLPAAATRGAVCLLGPLLGRGLAVTLPRPGGCAIGPRPIDLHLRALRAFGAEIEDEGDRIVASAGRLRGATVDLCGPHGPSVTGTAVAVLAAVAADGPTVILNPAREPEVAALVTTLRRMGAAIETLSTRLRITGGHPLEGTTIAIPPDRIEAATWLCAALSAGGEIEVDRVPIGQLDSVFDALREAGLRLEVIAPASVRATACRRPRPVSVTALPYPGFPTDLQAPLTAALLRADGTSAIGDAVFPRRFGHLAQLRRFGASIVDADGEVRVVGRATTAGAEGVAGDLRAAAALAVAAFGAEGVSTVTGLAHLDRGYERFAAKAEAVGANVRVTAEADEPTSVTPAG